MREALTEVVEGWTDALPFILKSNGSPVDLTGLTVSIVLKDSQGTVLNQSTSGITVTSSTAGEVSYTPQSTSEFIATKTPYKVRFKVVDALTATAYFPNIDEDLIKVNAV